jgi:hypothetical protein
MALAASNRLSPPTVRVLDRYSEQVLGCPPLLARAGGLHLLVVASRGLPIWHGFTMPIVVLNLLTGAVVACRPDLVERLRSELGSDVDLQSVDLAAFRRLWRAVQRCTPNAFTLAGDFRAADDSTFSPSRSSTRAELIAPDDTAALHLRTRFDGPIFGVRGPHGRLVSWAALKLKSEAVWEIAVETMADYRGRGYARDVVSAATAHTLEQQRVPIYIHDHDNATSAFVARHVGYQRYAEIILSEY